MTRRTSIQKQRTSRQREQSRRFSQSTATRVLILPRDLGLPASSWWATAPPHGFTRIAQQESQRMRLSQFGTVRKPMFGDEA